MGCIKTLSESNNSEEIEKKLKYRKEILSFLSQLNEKQKRLYVGLEAKILGYGGIQKMSQLTKIDRRTISKGMKELKRKSSSSKSMVRKKGGGRKTVEETMPGIEEALLKIVENDTAGHPTGGKKWVRKSLGNICKELKKKGYTISPPTASRLLKKMVIPLNPMLK